MRDADDPARGLEAVTSLLRDAASEPVEEAMHAEGRRRLVEAAETARFRRQSRRGRGALAGALAAAAALGGFALWYRFAPSALSYEVQNNTSSVASYVSAESSAPATVHFSDGSDVIAVPGSRLRVEETKKDGARVLLERGAAIARVVHRERSSWLFVAGPFDVHVTGTQFTLAWDPEKEEVNVTLHEGSVEIDSPIGPSHYSVRAGHRLFASLHDGIVRMDDVPNSRAEVAAPKPPANSPGVAGASPNQGAPGGRRSADQGAADEQAARELRPLASSGPAVHEEAWSDLVRQGAFDTVVAAAKERGVLSCLEGCSLLDLRALGDAARYSGDAELARKSFTSIRSRFSGTHQGAAAAFFLGRIAEPKDLASADRWYGAYLAEAPNGEFASDALAGRMRTVTGLSGPSAGARIAEEYLHRFPDGVHGAAAHKLVGSN